VNRTETSPDSNASRDFIIGAHSRVWLKVARGLGAQATRFITLRHTQVADHDYHPGDRVWVLAYSRQPEENLRLLEQLQHVASQAEVIYISSSACIAANITHCYEYPRVKQQAADDARRLLGARVLTLGLIYDDPEELPRGTNAATSVAQLRSFLLSPEWPADSDTNLRLFTIVERRFANTAEAALHRLYGMLLSACKRWPCALRPLDALLRACGIRWYGYTYLSNRLWTAKS